MLLYDRVLIDSIQKSKVYLQKIVLLHLSNPLKSLILFWKMLVDKIFAG